MRQTQPVQFQHRPSSDMERKQDLDQIKELVQTVQTLLDANIALGNKQKELQAESDRKIAVLQDQVDKLTGELQARRRKMHGKNNEKQTGDKSVNTGKTKDEEEGEYIENGCEQPSDSDSDSDESDEVTDTEATNPKKDLSQRPDHYKTMKAEVFVVHDCDKDKLKAIPQFGIRNSA